MNETLGSSRLLILVWCVDTVKFNVSNNVGFAFH